MIKRTLAAALVATVALSGCGGPLNCTLIGCSDTLTFRLNAQAALFAVGEPVEVTACIASECATEVVTLEAGSSFAGSASFSFNGPAGALEYRPRSRPASTASVSLTLKKQNQVVLDERRDGVTFTGFSPNGPGCGPNCAQASVTL